MFTRQIHKQPLPLPSGTSLKESKPLPLENVSHTPGQAAAIRFFDPDSEEDLLAMREILKGKQTRKWMDDPGYISLSDYQDWAGTRSKTSFLFAVLDARATNQSDMSFVRGFIYIYSQREEKFRVRRMEKLGFIEAYDGERYMLEASFAVRPLPDGMQSGSGLMSSALRQSCLQVKMLLDSPREPKVEVFAFVDQENLAAQRTLESSGLVQKGCMKYDWDSYDETCLYLLDWEILQKKVRDKMMDLLQQQEEPAKPLRKLFEEPLAQLSVSSDQLLAPTAEFSHIPGQAAAIRFFDPESETDFNAAKAILEAREVQQWMVGTEPIERTDYQTWAGRDTDDYFLFAVLNARGTGSINIKEVRGFVYVYCTDAEKERIDRMKELGLIQPEESTGSFLEVSFAVKPPQPGQQAVSGLMSSALRQACLQVTSLLRFHQKNKVLIFGSAHPENLPAQRTLEAAGFEKRGEMKYDIDSTENDIFYILNLDALQAKISAKLP